MLIDKRLAGTNTLTLTWHAGASTVAFEAFRAWCLATLKQQLRFDGAIWGVLLDPRAGSATRLQSAHLHGVDPGAMEDLERVRVDDFAAERREGDVLAIHVGDRAWAGGMHAPLRQHARDHGMSGSISACFANTGGPGRQFLMLTRNAGARRFGADDVAAFEWLAPHMVHAFANCRSLFVQGAQATSRRSAVSAVALVDSVGVLHDAPSGFTAMLQREWSDWRGERLPEPVLEMTARRAGTRWRFIGSQIVADFSPVDDLYLVTARPRHMIDSLSQREIQVAHLYGDGHNFREIADALGLSPATVRSHLRKVFTKLQVRNKSQLAAVLR